MLHSIGKRRDFGDDSGGLVERLVDCHARIRQFVGLARTVAAASLEVPDGEVVETCARIERYFTQALPLHVADEEHSLAPRLQGRVPELDAALATMREQHAEHELELAALLEALEALRREPNDASLRAALGASAGRLEQAFFEHLELEETQVFPSLAVQLSDAEQAEIVAEMRARRTT